MKLKYKSHLWIEGMNGLIIGEGRARLLKAIDDQGSIALGAKSLQISYRHAWEMIKAMNNGSAQPLVVTTKGGKTGGGTSLTFHGKKILEAYTDYKKNWQEFKNQKLKGTKS